MLPLVLKAKHTISLSGSGFCTSIINQYTGVPEQDVGLVVEDEPSELHDNLWYDYSLCSLSLPLCSVVQ